MKEQPFHIGQRVVAIKDAANNFASIKKGQEFIVRSMTQCVYCKKWRINVGLSSIVGHQRCSTCMKNLPEINDVVYVDACVLAPITDNFIEIEYARVLELEKPLIAVN